MAFMAAEQRQRFWGRCGFLPNGRDEWDVPLMIRKPENTVSFTVEELADPEDWQLLKLMNGYLHEIGEECLEEEKQEQLQQAIKDGKITFAPKHFSTYVFAEATNTVFKYVVANNFTAFKSAFRTLCYFMTTNVCGSYVNKRIKYKIMCYTVTGCTIVILTYSTNSFIKHMSSYVFSLFV